MTMLKPVMLSAAKNLSCEVAQHSSPGWLAAIIAHMVCVGLRRDNLLAQSIVTIGQDRSRMMVKVADILPARRAHGAHRFVGRVIGDSRENAEVA